MANGKKIVDHVGSNKNIEKTKRNRSSTHGGDRKTRPITNHDRRGARRMGGRTEERIPASGVVWNEAPKSAIQSVLTGGVSPMVLKDCASPMVLKDCARAAWSHLPDQG